MRPILDLSLLSNWLRLTALCMFILSLQGCAAMKDFHWFSSGRPDKEIERNDFPIARGDDVIGRLAIVKLEKGDTLPDIARHFGLGINAVSAANPGLDLWVPEAGESIVLPLSFILPDTPRKGIVINVATMRLFRFKGNGNPQMVSTY